jgi:prepilin-type N-terminal cleavage/methylation domain-containing protein
MKPYIKTGKYQGFSLVELSVVLAVIGITLGGALTIATKKTEADKVAETERKMDLIERALNRYLTTYYTGWAQRLPCPAAGATAINSSTFGNETATPTAAGCTADFNSGRIYGGVVPTKYLRLPDDVMIDGWGHRMTYVVDYYFANSITTNSLCDGTAVADHKTCFKYADSGTIRINDASGNARTTTAVYAIISHGPNGSGAWTYNGSATRLAASADASEQSNAGNDAGSFDNIFVQKDKTSTFDDIVRYRTKWQIIDDAKAITDPDVCSAALYQVSNPGDSNAACTGIGDETICRALAAQVNSWCY